MTPEQTETSHREVDLLRILVFSDLSSSLGQERRTSNTINAFPSGIFTKKPFPEEKKGKQRDLWVCALSAACISAACELGLELSR